MSEPLTLAEAVPLGTVHLQRLLADAGVRSLVIKGPAFVELGVRPARQSHDIDLLIQPSDAQTAYAALSSAGWVQISYYFPDVLLDVVYSKTFRHAASLFPITLDLHHRFSGVFAWPEGFESLWEARLSVEIAHQEVATVCPNHALIIEALNRFKSADFEDRSAVGRSVLANTSRSFDVDEVRRAAAELGAGQTAGQLIEVMGGGSAPAASSPELDRWISHGSRVSSAELLLRILLEAPQEIPRVVWWQLTLDDTAARFWATQNDVEYTSRSQILRLRLGRAVRQSSSFRWRTRLRGRRR